MKGFLGNLERMYEQADVDGPQWEAFLTAWSQEFGEESVTVAELVAAIGENGSGVAGALPDALADAFKNPHGSFQKRLGKALSARVDRRYGDTAMHIVRAEEDNHAKVARWSVRGATTPGGRWVSANSGHQNPASASDEAATTSGSTAGFAGFSPNPNPADETGFGGSATVWERGGVEQNPANPADQHQGPEVSDLKLAGFSFPQKACYSCQGRRFWRRPTGTWICAHCHPPAPDPVFEWCDLAQGEPNGEVLR